VSPHFALAPFLTHSTAILPSCLIILLSSAILLFIATIRSAAHRRYPFCCSSAVVSSSVILHRLWCHAQKFTHSLACIPHIPFPHPESVCVSMRTPHIPFPHPESFCVSMPSPSQHSSYAPVRHSASPFVSHAPVMFSHALISFCTHCLYHSFSPSFPCVLSSVLSSSPQFLSLTDQLEEIGRSNVDV